jgi:hypothetical protein
VRHFSGEIWLSQKNVILPLSAGKALVNGSNGLTLHDAARQLDPPALAGTPELLMTVYEYSVQGKSAILKCLVLD